MKRRSGGVAVVIMSLALPLPAWAQAQCAPPDLDQQWTPAQRQQFWFESQGSRLLPYSWFLALEDPEDARPRPFKDTLGDLGFIPQYASPENPGGLPIGFAVDGKAENAAVGLTCAACHTARLSLNGTPVIIEGGPTRADFTAFLRNLEAALVANAVGDRFDRFKVAVLGVNAPAEGVAALRLQMNTAADTLAKQWNAFVPTVPAGPGRVDAFGLIYNRVVAFDIQAPNNARLAAAPVSYPFLWNTPQHDKVQWNGSASNRLPLGLGPLVRNVGEALGVFGEIKLHRSEADKKKGPNYPSSIRLDRLRELEQLLTKLRPPAWPKTCAPVDEALVAQGRLVYKATCKKCHSILDRKDLETKFKAKLIDFGEVGTDPAMALSHRNNFDEAVVETGLLEGRPKTVRLLSRKFRATSTGGAILTHAIIGTILGKGTSDEGKASTAGAEALAASDARVLNALRKALEPEGKYKARPLNGIWATAPYLHNGSVPNLRQLLDPSLRTESFYVGSGEFDFKDVGLPVEAGTGTLFDTTMPGNSNAGHRYGAVLSKDERRALLEYLKVIGERP